MFARIILNMSFANIKKVAAAAARQFS